MTCGAEGAGRIRIERFDRETCFGEGGARALRQTTKTEERKERKERKENKAEKKKTGKRQNECSLSRA